MDIENKNARQTKVWLTTQVKLYFDTEVAKK